MEVYLSAPLVVEPTLWRLCAPMGPVYQAGTLSGNPVAMASGLATINLLSEPGFFEAPIDDHSPTSRRPQSTRCVARHLACDRFKRRDVRVFFSEADPVTNFEHVMACDAERFTQFFKAMLAKGIYLAPSPFESGFVSAAHDDQDIETTLQAADEAFAELTH